MREKIGKYVGSQITKPLIMEKCQYKQTFGNKKSLKIQKDFSAS